MRELEGDSVADVLSYVEYEPKNMTGHSSGAPSRSRPSGKTSSPPRSAGRS